MSARSASCYHLQKLGARPRRQAASSISPTTSSSSTPSGPAMLGGIVPVPVALGISDEHQAQAAAHREEAGQALHLHRPQRRSIASAHSPPRPASAACSTACARVPSSPRHVDDISQRRQGALPSAPTTWRSSSSPPARPASRRASCSRTGNILANALRRRRCGDSRGRRRHLRTWMPLTHDMGLIGMHIMMFAHRMHVHIMPDRALHPPAAAVDDVLPRASAPRSPARPISATGTT